MARGEVRVRYVEVPWVSSSLAQLPVTHASVWRIDRADAFGPKHGVKKFYTVVRRVMSSTSARRGTLGKSFTMQLPVRFCLKFRHSIRAVSGAPLSSSGLEEA